MSKLYSITDILDWLGVCRTTFHTMRKDGFPAPTTSKPKRWSEDDIKAWLESR